MKRKNKADGALPGGREFSKTYPMLGDAVLIYEEFDFSGRINAGVHSVCRHGHRMECSNALCHEGGYDLRPEVELMMSLTSQLTKPICLQCEGWETKPRHSNGNVCTGSIEGTLELHMKKGQRSRKLAIPGSAAS